MGMDLLERLNHYLQSSIYPRAGQPHPAEQDAFPFITISRETGAGAHSLANQLLVDMAREPAPLFSGWQIFDAAFCARLLQDNKIQASLDMLQREVTCNPWEETVYELMGGRTASDQVFSKTIQAMKFLAQLGKLIVIGRGGACATAHMLRGIHVRLVAPVPFRIRRLKERLNAPEANVKRLLEDYDMERAKFVRAHFGQDVRDPLLYHAVWNTERASMPEISTSLLEMAKERASRATLLRFDAVHS